MATDPAQEHPESEEPDQEGLFDAQMSLPLPFVEAPEPFTTVRKRNGREEPFERAKIANAIFRAAQSIGGEDRDLADSLARAVTIYLTKQLVSHAPTVDHIHDAVERVLVQMAHIRTAFAYARYRDRRARIRRLREGDMRLILSELQEARGKGMGAPLGSQGLFVRTSADTITSWDRDRIVEALVRETELDKAMAEVVAVEVEQQLEAAGIQHLTAALVRELVAARLVAHGLQEFRDRHQRLGVPLYDCERIIRGLTEATDHGDPVATDYVLAGAVKKEYALARIYSPHVSEAHLQGALHLHHLDKVDRFLTATLSPGMVARFGVGMPGAPDFASPPRNAVTFLAQLAKATANFQAHFSDSLTWDAVNFYFAPFVYGYTPEELAQFAQMIVYEFAYRAMAHGADGPGTELQIRWTAPPEFSSIPAVGAVGEGASRTYGEYEHTAQQLAWKIFEVLEKCDGLNVTAPVLGICIDDDFFKVPGGEDFLARATATVATGLRLRFHFQRSSDAENSAAYWQPAGTVFDQVSLNLPRLAYDTGSESRFLDAAATLLSLAGLALQERRDFLESLLARDVAGPLGLLAVRHDDVPLVALGTAAGHIAIHGLNEAVQVLTNTELHDGGDAPELAARILRHLQEKCRLESRRRGFVLHLAQGLQESPSRRFARLDASKYPKTSKTVINIDESNARMAYSAGCSLSPGNDCSPFEAAQIQGRLHCWLDAGRMMQLDLRARPFSASSVAALVKKAYFQTKLGGIDV